MRKRLKGLTVVAIAALVAGACASGRAFRQGEASMRAGNIDEAVSDYRRAVQANPDNPRYKIALERAMQAASRSHLERAQKFEQDEQLEAALGEYKLASEFDPSNRGVALKVSTLEKTIRDRIEAARPRPPGQQLRALARAASAEPILNPSVDRLNLVFTNTGFKDVLNVIAINSGINVTYDRDVTERPMTIQISDVSVEQALNQIMTMNQLSFKVVNAKSIFVFQDTVQKHQQYDEQVIQTFYVQHADVTELGQILSAIIRLPNLAVPPVISFNKTNNTMTIRASTAIMQILQKVIDQNDKPRAEIVFDIEILEVDRERAKTYGLNLSEFAVGSIFSPEVSPSSTTTAAAATATAVTGAATGTTTGTTTGGTTTTNTGRSTAPSTVQPPPPFNLNTITRGVSTADFYLAVPTAIVKFLESDTKSRLLAKPQLRGAEGAKLTLNLGSQVPIVTTSYTPIATGGAGVNPLNSFQLKDVGINIDITPRVTIDGDILLDLTLESNAEGPLKEVAGTFYPSFTQRKVSTRLRLRDGESNLLAGLLREDEQNSVQGVPGAVHVPFLKQVFSGNKDTKSQIDLILLLTPHIVRTSEVTEADLRPIYIGSQQNLGLGGPPPLIALPEAEPAAPAPTPRAPGTAPGAPAGAPQTPPGTTLVPPPGSTPVPGFVAVPQSPPAAAQPGQSTQPGTAPTPSPPPAPPPQAAAPAVAPAAPSPNPPATGRAPAPSANEPTTTTGVGLAQVLISPPGTAFRVGQGPYTVPLTIVNATRLTTLTLTLTYDPAVLRVRSVQEGSFLRSGGATATFTQQQSPGRIDLTIARTSDATGATGTGPVAAVVFDAIAPGTVSLSLNGAGTGPGGTTMGLQFLPATVTVQQ